jgi:hypothetical protein
MAIKSIADLEVFIVGCIDLTSLLYRTTPSCPRLQKPLNRPKGTLLLVQTIAHLAGSDNCGFLQISPTTPILSSFTVISPRLRPSIAEAARQMQWSAV